MSQSCYIHCNTDLFNKYALPGLSHRSDPTAYAEPDELLVQLTHRDVYLDYFKPRQDLIEKLRSGMQLSVRDGCLWVKAKSGQVPVASFSKAFKDQLARWAAKGYFPVSAAIQFVVAWKGENDEKETLILLPTIKLKKSTNNL